MMLPASHCHHYRVCVGLGHRALPRQCHSATVLSISDAARFAATGGLTVQMAVLSWQVSHSVLRYSAPAASQAW